MEPFSSYFFKHNLDLNETPTKGVSHVSLNSRAIDFGSCRDGWFEIEQGHFVWLPFCQNTRDLVMTSNAYFSLSKHSKQLLLVTFCDIDRR